METELILSLLMSVVNHAQVYPKYSEIPNLQYNDNLILDLILNGEYSESLFSNHIIVFSIYKPINSLVHVSLVIFNIAIFIEI